MVSTDGVWPGHTGRRAGHLCSPAAETGTAVHMALIGGLGFGVAYFIVN